MNDTQSSPGRSCNDLQLKEWFAGRLAIRLLELQTAGGPVRLAEARRFADMWMAARETWQVAAEHQVVATTPLTCSDTAVEGRQLFCGHLAPVDEAEAMLRAALQVFTVKRSLLEGLVAKIQQLEQEVDNAMGDLRDQT